MKLDRTTIGALHLAPLMGYAEFPGEATVIKLAIEDLIAFQNGGIDAVIFENNYDLPHHEKISDENYQLMLKVGRALNDVATVPLGINVLWNDYKSALRLAKELDLQFIRVPVFVDDVTTTYGQFKAVGSAVSDYRERLDIPEVQIFADIHVKHATITSTFTIEESAQRAIDAGADGIIVTGKWTGDSPDEADLKNVRSAIGDFPIIIGSGADSNNINDLFKYANGAIVSTALKQGEIDASLTNLAGWNQRISVEKVRKFTKASA